MATAPEALAAFHDYEPETEDFEAAVVDGLSKPQKTLPCKFFYDAEGSALFDRICELAEYYPTRTEIALLEDRSGEIARLAGPRCHLIEFGSGSSVKVRILLDALKDPVAYTAIDISRDHLLAATESLAAAHPEIEVRAVCADYTKPIPLPRPERHPDARPIGFFPGSSLGNFTPPQATAFLKRTAGMLREGRGDLVIGIDLQKDPAILIPAYDDSEGVTAAFNKNILVRANRELGTDFDLDGFSHRAVYNNDRGRVEMHLVSDRDQAVTVGSRSFDFAAGEHIHTENSHKYTVAGFQAMAREAGFVPSAVWCDAANLFSIHYLRTVPSPAS
jgi:L-histidine Nalpha-methyltransferase